MKNLNRLLLAGAFALAGVFPTIGAGLFTNGLPVAGGSSFPTTLPLTGNETIPADTNLTQGLNPASEAITVNQLGSQAGVLLDSWRNKLIGGDFAANLWQRGTTSAAVTTALLYTADRWWALSGTATEVKLIKQTSSQATGIGASARFQRTASQTGVVASCVGQVLTSANSYDLAGKVVEFSFYAKAGANFSAASSAITATIATGTGADGSAANFSTGSWTGYAAAVAQSMTISTSWVRYSAVATIPTTAVQAGVKICFTPVGTAGANDWVEFANAQLAINPAAVAATTSTDTNYNILEFESRSSQLEGFIQRAYYWQLDESAAIFPVAPCAAIDTTHTNCFVTFPSAMRIVPTMSYANGFASPTSTTQATLGACSTLASAATVASTVAGLNGVLVNCTATTIPAAGVASFLYSNNGSGSIRATAEL